MAYRNGTYIAFHANNSNDPTASDIKYYRLLKAWHANDNVSFRFVNSHEKTSAVRDTSTKETLRRSLKTRLDNSCRMILIIGETTRNDTDWVPFEISYAVDVCQIPLIVAYTGYNRIRAPAQLSSLWPPALYSRINAGSVRAIHIPFVRNAIDDAITQFGPNNQPATSLNCYSDEAHRSFGV